MKLLRHKAVIEATGLSRMTIWRLERARQFPQRRRLGPSAVGWVQAEIDEWIASRPATVIEGPCLVAKRDSFSTPKLGELPIPDPLYRK